MPCGSCPTEQPDFGTFAREEFGKWFGPELIEHLFDGLRKAGLEIASGEGTADAVPSAEKGASPEAGTDALTIPGFGGRPAIARLPCDNRSGDPEQEYFADGLAEDLTTRLSLWRSFPVIARNSSFVYKPRPSM